MFSLIKPKKCALALLGSAILAFGLYNVHALSGVTEGGVLGMTLFLHHWVGLSPAVTGLVMNAICYLMGWKLLGKEFIAYSIVAGGGFSLFYSIVEQFDPLWPQLADHPLLAAVLGALFVGCGVAKVKIEGVTKYIIPLFFGMVVALFLITYIPAIPMIVPYLTGLVDTFWWVA